MSEKAREISKKMQEAATKNFSRLKELCSLEQKTPMERGWIAHEMKANNQFTLLGYNTEGEARTALKIGRSTWFRYVGLAEKLNKLGKEEFVKLIPENADHLARLDPKLRYRRDLVKAAQTMTEEEFEKLLVKHRAADEDADEDDVVVSLKFRLTEGQRKAIKSTFDWFAGQHEIPKDEESKILELICAEIKHGKPVVTAMMRATGRLGEAEKLLNGGSGDLAADEVIKQSHGIVAGVMRDMCAAGGVKVPEQRVH